MPHSRKQFTEVEGQQRRPINESSEKWFLHMRHTIVDRRCSLCYAYDHEHGHTASDPRASWVVTSTSRGGDRPPVRRSRVILPGPRQSSGEVRDAACPCDRWAERDGGRRAARLLACGVLSDYDGVWQC